MVASGRLDEVAPCLHVARVAVHSLDRRHDSIFFPSDKTKPNGPFTVI